MNKHFDQLQIPEQSLQTQDIISIAKERAIYSEKENKLMVDCNFNICDQHNIEKRKSHI